jgi:hypothetical protein
MLRTKSRVQQRTPPPMQPIQKKKQASKFFEIAFEGEGCMMTLDQNTKCRIHCFFVFHKWHSTNNMTMKV